MMLLTATGAAAGAAFVAEAAAAVPGPTNAARAAITAVSAGPRLTELFLAISPSLSLAPSRSNRSHEHLSGLCGGSAGHAPPFRGSRRRDSLVRVTSAVRPMPSKRGACFVHQGR